MKKSVILILVLCLLAIFSFNFALAATQTVLISPSSGAAGAVVIYNISVQNTDATYNMTAVSIDYYDLNVSTSSVGTSTGVVPVQSGSTFTFTGNPIIENGTTRYFWFNATEFSVGTFNINVTTTDIVSGVTSENKTITISDTVDPVIAFVFPTPANDDILEVDSIIANFSVGETGSGVKNVTIYLYNATALISTQTDTSAPYTYTFTSLEDDTYYLNATAWDYANNSDSTSTRTIEIAIDSSCLPNWTCSWSECINGTQTQENCTDANSCGYIAPAATKACESCVSNWDCGEWIPAACSGDSNQTRLCTDLNSCEAPDTETRTCVVGGASTANASGLSLFSSSTLFFVVLGLIVASVLGVLILLIRLKKKSSSANSGNFDSGYPVYSPPRGPPSFPPSGYANSPQAYPNQPQNY